MVKLEKNIASKKPVGGKLQKPLKQKENKGKVLVKNTNLIKEAAKPELVKNVQNGKAGKKNQNTNGVSKKEKQPKAEIPQEVKKPLKKGKAEIPQKPQVLQKAEVPAKKAKKVKAADVVQEVIPAKKGKKVPEQKEVPPTIEKSKKKAKENVKPVVEKPVVQEKPKKKSVQAKENIKPVAVEEKPKKKAAQVQAKENVKPVVPTQKKKKGEVKPVEVKKEPVAEEKPQKVNKPTPVQNGNAVKKSESKKAPKKGKNPVESVVEEGSQKVFEAPPFSEDDFNKILTRENIVKIVTALKKTVKDETENKKEIFTDYRYLLDVSAHKIANCPKRMVKLSLKHPIVQQKEDDIVLFVSDLQRGRKVDHDPTIEHYENILRQNNIEGVKVIPFNQLKNEYSGFENKRKLVNSYEHFLCDGRIVANVTGFLGSLTKKPRTTLHAVRMEEHCNIEIAIKKAIRRTAYRQLSKGNMTTIPVASHRHTPEEVADNILLIIKQLKDIYPGGLANIRSFNVKVGVLGTSSLPLYLSMVQGPDSNPYVVGPREQKILKLKRETKDVLSKFKITNEGKIERLTQEQIAKKRKIQEGKLGEAVSEEVSAKKAKKEKKKNKKEEEEKVKEEPEEEKIEELVRLEGDEDDSEDDAPVELVKEGEEFEDDDEEDNDEELEFEDDDDDEEEDDEDDGEDDDSDE